MNGGSGPVALARYTSPGVPFRGNNTPLDNEVARRTYAAEVG